MRALPSLLLLVLSCGGSDAVAPAQLPHGAAAPQTATPAAKYAPPVAERRPVTDTYHGVQVVDAYRWLEEDTAEVKAWSDAQNAHARRLLDALPEVDALRQEIRAIVAAPIIRYSLPKPAGKRWFLMRKDPAKEQAEVIVIDDLDHPERATVVVDPTARSAHDTVDWFVPSPDGKTVAVSISAKGSEEGTLHFFSVDGREVDTPIPNVERGTAGGDAAWRADGKGIFYTRYPAPGEKPDAERDFWMQVWHHELGAPASSDRHEIGRDLPRIAEIVLTSDERGRLLVAVQNGDSGGQQHHLRDSSGRWRQLTDWDDGIVFVGFGPGEDLYGVSLAGAPRGKIVRFSVSGKKSAKKPVPVTVVPEGNHAIVSDFWSKTGVVATRDRLFAVYQTGGPTELRSFTHAGAAAAGPKMPPVSWVGQPVATPSGVLFATSSYTRAPRLMRLDARGEATELTALSPAPPVDLSGFEVWRETATSKDGTRVPYTVVMRAGAALDGTMPCVVSGYGAYGLSRSPSFLDGWSPLLRRGVCYVEANIRGGGEFGDAWHRAAMRSKKQVTFDDFAAVLEEVAAKKISSPDRIAIFGGSAGGLLMGAMITQHPDRMRAVVCRVGVLDALRSETSPNGEFNIPEFGTVADKTDFDAMLVFSPYHRVEQGTSYPAILMPVGANDPRVPPWHSRKMVAALQAAQKGDAPILLRTSDVAGHGAGTNMSEAIEERAHIQSFILSQIGRPR